jgi:hypothetical protein
MDEETLVYVNLAGTCPLDGTAVGPVFAKTRKAPPSNTIRPGWRILPGFPWSRL